MTNPQLFTEKQREEQLKQGVPQEYLNGLQERYEKSMKDKTNYTVYQQHPTNFAGIDTGYPETFTEYKKRMEDDN